MALQSNRYGKDRVRVMRIDRDGEHHTVSELSVKAMIEGDFARAYTHADNSTSICTDTIKNVVIVVARENLSLGTEAFCGAVAERLLDAYPQVETAMVTAHRTKWARLEVGGAPHPHSFFRDSNGRPFAEVSASRAGHILRSGIDGFTFMKSTGSGWENFAKDAYTTLKETADRICATSMVASWLWTATPQDYEASSAAILDTMLRVFATTYSHGVQDSLYRMGEAALAAIPEIGEIDIACPNIHYIPINLSAFELDNQNQIFLPTDEPHGQIECRIVRE